MTVIRGAASVAARRTRDVTKLGALYGLAPGEQGKSPDDLWAASLGRRLEAMTKDERADLLAAEPRTETVRRLDRLSLRQLLATETLSAEAIEFLSVAAGVDTLLDTAATEHLREEHVAVWTQGFDEIVGGADRLPAALAAQLRSKPRMGSPIVRLEHDPLRRKAAAVYRQAGRLRRVEGDFVLCTLPFPVLARIEIVPELSGEKRRAIRELSYDSATKILAVTGHRFWEQDDHIYGGGTYTDLPTGTTWYPGDNATARDARVSAAPAVFLASYSWGQTARRWASMAHGERSQWALRHLSRVHPQLAKPDVVRRTASWTWDTHPWSGGAFAWFMPGQHTALHRHVVAPEGRIYFAGEHASLTHTWMQGALESALVAVREMLAAASS